MNTQTTENETWARAHFRGKMLSEYEVSDLGSIRSFRGKRPLSKVIANERTVSLSAVVLESFGGPRPVDFCLGYRNGDRDDVRLANLRWIHIEDHLADIIPRKRGSKVLQEADFMEAGL